ncbi:MAG: GHKL domain-containing protein [Candidatus Omnitrophica bacterium]|nr:GHKL domain-containing protein [Candidatus Omnitrophota bacterium]
MRSKEKIRRRILLPFILVVAVMMGVFSFAFYRHMVGMMTMKVDNALHEMSKLFESKLDSDAELLSGLVDLLKEDKQIQNFWLAKDRQGLLKYTEPLFKELRSKYRVTHFYFHGLDKICFLRVHNSSRHGDLIKRFTIDGASKAMRSFYGIELGPFGTFTLRLVHPWFINGKQVGYLELGEEIDHMIPQLKQVLGADLIFTIEKKYLKRQRWKEGLQMVNKTGKWDFLTDSVVAGSTFEDDSTEDALLSILQEGNAGQSRFQFKDMIYRGSVTPLIDAGKRNVGNFFVFIDATGDEKELFFMLFALAGLSLLVAFVVGGGFYVYLGRIESELAAARNDLETTNFELETKKSLLEKTNKELDHFTHTASHDLRAPLRAIVSFSTFLEEDCKDKMDAQGKEYISEITSGAKRMGQLIEDLLKLTRISRLQHPYENVDMNDLILSITERLKFDIESNKIDLKVAENIGIVHCDKIKISEVFLNFINNAIKFSVKDNQNNPRIEIGYDKQDKFHQFYVKDNGIGIEAKYHQQVFKIFETLHSRDDYDGTGIGLGIVKTIVEEHQGTAWVESELGKGATFYFTISTNLKNKEA